MAQILVRGLDDKVKQQLGRRAKQHGRSMEAEVRDILCAAVAETAQCPIELGTRIARRFGGAGLDTPIEELREWDVRLPDLGE